VYSTKTFRRKTRFPTVDRRQLVTFKEPGNGLQAHVRMRGDIRRFRTIGSPRSSAAWALSTKLTTRAWTAVSPSNSNKRARGKSAAVTKARKRAEEYLLGRRMFRSLRTGEVIDERWLRFSFPTFWHYDVLRGLDYLRNAGTKPDRRVHEAIEVVNQRRHQNGRWPLNLLHRERIPLEMETAVGSASRWNTLHALRVLRWYDNAR